MLQCLDIECVRPHLVPAGAVSINLFWRRSLWGSLQEHDHAGALEDTTDGGAVTSHAQSQGAQRRGLAQGR